MFDTSFRWENMEDWSTSPLRLGRYYQRQVPKLKVPKLKVPKLKVPKLKVPKLKVPKLQEILIDRETTPCNR